MSLRIKAFLIHLLISLAILAGILYVVVYIWYPPPFFAADGGWQGVKIMLGVDLVLGPLLTLAVYNPGKGMDRLKRDMWTIAVVQFCSLTAGAWIVADQRTRMVSFADTRFVSMTETQINESGVTPEVLETLRQQRPAMAYVEMPDDPAKRIRLVMSSMGGTPLFKRGDLYRPLTLENRRKIMEQGYELDKVARAIPDLEPLITRFLQKINRTADQVSALPLYCRYAVLTLVMDRESGEILDTVDISHDELIVSHGWKRLEEKRKLENAGQ